MELFIRLYTFALVVVVLGIFARNIIRRSWDLISWRNLFLLGFLHFYLLGAYFTVGGGIKKEVLVIGVEASSWGPLAIGITVFLFLFLLCASLGRRGARWTWLFPRVELPVTTPAIIGSVVVLSSASLLFSVPFFNYFGLIAGNLRGQLAGCATGLAVYYLIVRRFNPAAWALMLATLGVSVIASTVGTAGRRMFLGVVLAVPWMLYFAVWRYRSTASIFARIGLFFVLGVMALVIYTPFRDPGTAAGRGFGERTTVSRRVDQFLQILSNPTFNPKVLEGIVYTDTVPATLWAMANYPDPHAYEPFKGAIWFVINPIPRALWPDKPVALGFEMARTLDTPPGFTMGPGVLTHGWVEGGFLGIAGYAIFFGLLVGLADRALAERAFNPFFLAAMGSAAGNVIALPRGDTPLFLIQIAAGVLGCALAFWTLKLLFGPIWAAFPLLPSPVPVSVGEVPADADAHADPQNMDAGDTPDQGAADHDRW